MINKDIQKNTSIWVVSQSIDKMIYPTTAKFIRWESHHSFKLVIIEYNQKYICCPTHLTFATKHNAQAYASINFLKMYYEFDPFFVMENIESEILQDAYELVEFYEKYHPSLYLYYWMGDTPNRNKKM